MPKKSKYSDSDIIESVKNNKSIAAVLRDLGIKPAGGSHAHISRRIERLALDTSHFTGKGHGSSNPNKRLHAHQILLFDVTLTKRRKPTHLRRALLEIGRELRCVICFCDGSWQGNPLTLHVDHIDGDFRNNIPVNLRFLCPNCHSQTSNYAGRKSGFQSSENS